MTDRGAQFDRPPPPEAIDLLQRPCVHRSGEAGRWRKRGGVLEVVPGTGDVYFDVSLPAFQLHFEFWLPYMPQPYVQDRANGGAFIDGRYEIQLLDSAGLTPRRDTCGAIYELRAPDHDAGLPPETWQSLDVAYRREDSGGRLSAFLNGVLVQNQVGLASPTKEAFMLEPRPVLLLQDHGAPLRFRNLWVLRSG